MSDSKYGKIFTQEDVLNLIRGNDFAMLDEEEIRDQVEEAPTHWPEDEPLFILRARDRRALSGLRSYQGNCTLAANNTSFSPGTIPQRHIDGINLSVDLFEQFKRNHPERVVEPGGSYIEATKGE